MRRALLTLAAAGLLLGAAPAPATVDYRLGVHPVAGQPPVLDVEIRFRGEADGETRLGLPEAFGGTKDAYRYLYGLTVKGAKVSEESPAVRVLRHRPGAKLTVRYRVQTAYPQDPKGADGNPYRGAILRPEWVAALGEFLFAAPDNAQATPARFQWGKLPKGWTAASDLDHLRLGRYTTVKDVVESLVLAAPGLQVIERTVPGGTLRLAAVSDGAPKLPAIADAVTPVLAAQRAFWNDRQEPYFVGFIPLEAVGRGGFSYGGTGRGDGFALYAARGSEDRLPDILGHEHIHSWIPGAVGRMPPEKDEPAVYWFSEGFADFFADRILARAGLIDAQEAAERFDGRLGAYEASPVKTAPVQRILADVWKDQAVQQLSYQRGALLALKWDEELRMKTRGARDLDDVILQMRDHYRQFRPGEGPDVVTGLISAFWVVGEMDIRADIARYAVRGELIPLPESFFGDCLYQRTNRKPAFDPGFDTAGSFAAKQLRGVRTRGPAWNSGLRNGQRLDAWVLKAGDTSQEVELTVRDNRNRTKKVRFWPYGDEVVETHDLLLRPGLKPDEKVACGKMFGGL